MDEAGDGRFWGEVRRDVRPEWKGKVRGGYAGFRNKVSFQSGKVCSSFVGDVRCEEERMRVWIC